MAEAARLRHLFRRAGFGARPAEIAGYRDQDLPDVVLRPRYERMPLLKT